MQDSSEAIGSRPPRLALAWPLLAVGALGAITAVAAWIAVSVWEERLALAQFNDVAGDYAAALQYGLDNRVDDLAKVRAFYDASVSVSEGEFELFTSRILSVSSRPVHDRDDKVSHTSLMRIDWSPRVLRDERAAFEGAERAEGHKDFTITRWSLEDQSETRAPHAEYFPVVYANSPGNDPALIGMDLNSEPVRHDTIHRAIEADKMAAAQGVRLRAPNGQGEEARGVFVALPVYGRSVSEGAWPSSSRTVRGVLSMTFETAPLIKAIVDGTVLPKTVNLYLFLATAGDRASPVFARTDLRHDQILRKDILAMPHAAADLSVGDVGWDLLITPSGSGLTDYHLSWFAVVTIGLIFAALIVYRWVSLAHTLRLESANEKISQLAQTDNLTELANRRAFLKQLKMAFTASMRGAPSFAVLYLDIDDFKDVNDTLGHDMGDDLLKKVVTRLKQVVRNDDVVARIGGDEFAILATRMTDTTVAAALASRIREALATPFFIDTHKLSVTCSIGIAMFSRDVAGPEALMVQADLALYGAKDDGRNCYCFHSEDLDRQVHERVHVADELRAAIENGDMELHYQPQVDLVSGRLTGLEALVRWNHRTRGLLTPASFIETAERSGVILPLGRWILDEACRQMKAWRADGIAPDVLAINVSGVQLKNAADMEKDVAESIAKWNIDPGDIELELTESVLMEATQRHSDTLENLRRLGMRISIDDFGTGYSSLKYLTTYPVNRLKLAQEFVFRVTVDYRNAAVVRAAVRLAHELGLDVIAEGVETEAQMRFLVGAGCEEAQGYYFSAPVAVGAATALLRAGRIEPKAGANKTGTKSAQEAETQEPRFTPAA